jgi:hypothetical protein
MAVVSIRLHVSICKNLLAYIRGVHFGSPLDPKGQIVDKEPIQRIESVSSDFVERLS